MSQDRSSWGLGDGVRRRGGKRNAEQMVRRTWGNVNECQVVTTEGTRAAAAGTANNELTHEYVSAPKEEEIRRMKRRTKEDRKNRRKWSWFPIFVSADGVAFHSCSSGPLPHRNPRTRPRALFSISQDSASWSLYSNCFYLCHSVQSTLPLLMSIFWFLPPGVNIGTWCEH